MTDQLQFDLDPAARILSHVEAVLDRKAGPWPIEPDIERLLRLLREHRGAERAVTIAELRKFLPPSMDDRAIKAGVKSLVEDFGVPIGASRQEPYGYFLAVSAADIEIALRPYVNELRSLSRRVRALGGAHRLQELLGQMQIEMKDPEEAA